MNTPQDKYTPGLKKVAERYVNGEITTAEFMNMVRLYELNMRIAKSEDRARTGK